MEITAQMASNSRDLELEFQWFRQVLDVRLKSYFGQEVEVSDIFEVPPPALEGSTSNWAQFVAKYQPNVAERLAVLLALAPQLVPRLLDVFFTKNAQFDRPFSEFGGQTQDAHKGFLPTGETLLFLLAAQQLDRRFAATRILRADHPLIKDQILSLEYGDASRMPMSRLLKVSSAFVAQVTHGEALLPSFSQEFPATQIETNLEWEDVVLPAQTRRQVQEIQTWIEHGETLMKDWGLADKIRPGFRALFYGRPGTGKTMTACLLAKATGRKIFRIDLSMVVSKYIGETEKNLAKVFQRAEQADWILFFDEADALFGRRTTTQSAHDRYANQEVAYLLQRIETFHGIIILASNFRKNLDEAFIRRFETIVEFPLPNAEQRLQIWQKGISEQASLAQDIDLPEIARRFELSGGAIINVIRYASLQALQRGSNELTLASLQQGIRRELIKEGKVL